MTNTRPRTILREEPFAGEEGLAVPEWLYDYPKLRRSEKTCRVFAVLLSWADDKGYCTWNVAEVGEVAHCSRAAVYRALRLLESLELIQRLPKSSIIRLFCGDDTAKYAYDPPKPSEIFVIK